MKKANERTRTRPSQRDRYRYVAFKIEAENAFDRQATIRALQTLAEQTGDVAAQPWLTRFNGRYGVLRVIRGHEVRARELLEAVRRLPLGGTSVETRIHTLSTSGTIASLQRGVLRGIDWGPRRRPRP